MFLNLHKRLLRLLERISMWCVDIPSMQGSIYGPVSQNDYDLILVSEEWT
jgi:hypothetical protein